MEIEGHPLYMIYPDGTAYTRIRRRFLKQTVSNRGYHRVGLSRDGKRKHYSVHRLVAEAFIPNPDNKPEVDHINQVRFDNRVENLRWVTSLENGQNKGTNKLNTSGHKNIIYQKRTTRWKFEKRVNKKRYHKHFRTKIEALVYKFCFILKSRISNFKNSVR